jgi:hypothetical protein
MEGKRLLSEDGHSKFWFLIIKQKGICDSLRMKLNSWRRKANICWAIL